jgi:hypothetical protein
MSKWEVISMDFVVGFLLTSHRHNAILVIVDKLTKSAHFILVRDTYDVTDVAHVFVSEVIHLHGIPRISFQIGTPDSLLVFGEVCS